MPPQPQLCGDRLSPRDLCVCSSEESGFGSARSGQPTCGACFVHKLQPSSPRWGNTAPHPYTRPSWASRRHQEQCLGAKAGTGLACWRKAGLIKEGFLEEVGPARNCGRAAWTVKRPLRTGWRVTGALWGSRLPFHTILRAGFGTQTGSVTGSGACHGVHPPPGLPGTGHQLWLQRKQDFPVHTQQEAAPPSTRLHMWCHTNLATLCIWVFY